MLRIGLEYLPTKYWVVFGCSLKLVKLVNTPAGLSGPGISY